MEKLRKHKALPLPADMLDHRGDVGFQVVEAVGDLVHAPFESVEPGPQRVAMVGHRLVRRWWFAAVQYGVEVLRVPAERDGQGLQRPGAQATLNNVVLDFADDGLRDVRALGQFALKPSKLVHTLVDDLGDCRPAG
jgi:hypothetical protein